MRLRLAHGSTVDLGRINTEETIIIEGVKDLRIKNLEVVHRTDGRDAAREEGLQHNTDGGRWPYSRAHVLLQNCTNLTIDRASVQGPNVKGGVSSEAYNPALEAQHAFNILNCNGVKLNNLKAREVFGDFVYFGGSTKNVQFNGGDFAKNGRMGISFTMCENIRIHGVWMDQMRRAAFDFEPNYATNFVRNVRIDSVILGERRLYFVAGWGKGDVSDIHFSNIHSTTGLNISVSSVGGIRRKNWTFDNCSGQKRVGGSVAPWTFRDVDGVKVTNVRQPVKPGRGLVLLNTPGCTNVVQSRNRIEMIPGA